MKYPFSFIDGTCVHCGAPQGLVFLDKYNKETNNPIYQINEMVCRVCRTKFRIHWTDIDGKMIPLCCSDEFKDDVVENMTRFALENRRKL